MIQAHRWVGGRLESGTGTECVTPPDVKAHVWYQVVAPDAVERQALEDELGLHELALEDALSERHPPKLEDFETHLFLIAHTPIPGETRPTRKLAIFLGKSWVVSVSRVPLEPVRTVEQRIQQEPARFLAAPERVAHALLDELVAGFELRVDDLVDAVEGLECGVQDRVDGECLQNIQDLRREAARLQRVVRAQRDVCQILARTNHGVLSRKITPYLRDVYDHCLRVHDLLEGIRESLAAARDGYLSAVNNRLSETMRVLTVIATIMMPLTVVAGIFGMNFDPMPGLKTPWGFWAAMGVMAALAGGMLVYFRRRRWI